MLTISQTLAIITTGEALVNYAMAYYVKIANFTIHGIISCLILQIHCV